MTLRLYIDESGIHKPKRMRIENRHFVVAGIAMTDDQATAWFEYSRELSNRWTLPSDFVLHDVQINSSWFAKRVRERGTIDLRFASQRHSAFHEDLNRVIDAADFTAFAIGIRVDALQRSLVEPQESMPLDVYPLALAILFERYAKFLEQTGAELPTEVVIEHSSQWQKTLRPRVEAFMRSGTYRGDGLYLYDYIRPTITVSEKQAYHPLELSDLLAGETRRWMDSDYMHSSERWQVFMRKFYAAGHLDNGQFGLKVFPVSDRPRLIERLQQHRESVRQTRGRDSRQNLE